MLDSICPICRSQNNELKVTSKDYLILNGRSDDFFVYFCRDCENGFSYPFLNNEELIKYYPDDYNCYKSHKSLTGLIQELKSGKDVRIIKKILKNTDKKILEIGSGSGFFLSRLAGKGFIVSGLEPGLSGVKYAKHNFGIDLTNCTFEDLVSKEKYDMIIAFHVLEHFNDPVSNLVKMKSLLKDDGILFIKVPRLDSWAANLFGKYWHGYDLPRHRTHFTKNGLTGLLKKEGFEIIKYKSDLDPLASIRFVTFKSCEYHENKYKFKILNNLPYVIKLFAATLVEVVMSPFRSGRMSIIVRKIN